MLKIPRLLTFAAFVLFSAALAPAANAFCGFYVAKADAELFNDASKVVIARDGVRTTITMANDYRGNPRDFAMVVPVPVVLSREQIRVREPELITRIDAYTAPRLVEYFDDQRCVMFNAPVAMRSNAPGKRSTKRSLGVKVEATYTVGEYDIVILSARESTGLETWLVENGYKIPQGAAAALAKYIAAGTKFFVAKINLDEKAGRGTDYLRPLQISFETDMFMLPIQLGMLNASGPQELFIFTLTRKGRVETVNYPTVEIPSNLSIPMFVRGEFGGFYKAMFDRAVADRDMRAVFLEYAWDMNWCDPCAADPLSVAELQALGADWVTSQGSAQGKRDVFATRLHVRYDKEHFPDDLAFVETADRSNFQGRYIVTHPMTVAGSCPMEAGYQEELEARRRREASNLARITNWDITSILERMKQIQ